MGEECPGWGKLTELVANHILADKHWNKLSAVMHADRYPNHLGRHRRAARPGANHLLLPRLIDRGNFFYQMRVDKGPFFYRTRHRYLPFLRCTIYLSEE